MGRIVAINGYPCCAKTSSVTPIFHCIFEIAIGPSQENFKYSFYFAGITLSQDVNGCEDFKT